MADSSKFFKVPEQNLLDLKKAEVGEGEEVVVGAEVHQQGVEVE